MLNIDYDLKSIQEARWLAEQGKKAADKLYNYTEEEIDRILINIVKAIEVNREYLAELAVEETGFGKVEDKAYKNHMASRKVYETIKDMKTIGVIDRDEANKIVTIAEPIGLTMGILPSTNPTSTAVYKSLIAIKSRNAIVFSPHPGALECTRKTVEIIHKAAIAAGAPENLVSCIKTPSMDATNELMNHKKIGMIIATGGPAMVKSAYSCGKPALGVGAGNSPSYIEKTANIEKAVRDIVSSKSFDNGTICSSEQSVIVEEAYRSEVRAEFERQGGYFLSLEELEKLCRILFVNGTMMNPALVGKSPQYIAEKAGISIPAGTKLLLGDQDGVGPDYPLSYEKLTTVLAFYTVRDWKEACDLSMKLLENGLGHTMNIHTNDEEMVMRFAEKPASRILVNTGGSQGGTGLSTGLMPSFTLGCGTWGGSSVSENVSPLHLINIKKITYGLKDCSSLVENDGSFKSNNINRSLDKEVCESFTCKGSYQSPASYVSKRETVDEKIEGSRSSLGIDNKDLADLIGCFLDSMKGVN